jgi:ketosteroid isomerase-like protein
MLESLEWGKDSRANTADAYRKYLGRFPRGAHASNAEEELSFLMARSQRDAANLDSFVAKYSASRHRGEIDTLRDEAAWQRTKSDENSLNAYLGSFPEGKHAGEAKGRLGELRDEAAWEGTNRGDENSLSAYVKAFPNGKHVAVASELVAKLHTPSNSGGTKPRPSAKELDEAAIRNLMKGYAQAFDARDAEALLKIWPNMGTKKFKEYKNTFAAVSAVSVQVDVRNIDLSGNGDTATANAVLTQAFTVKGGGGNQPKPRQDPAVFELTKANGNWVINNVR